MDLPNHNIEELLSDDSFLAWYFKTDPGAVNKWNDRLLIDKNQKKLAEEAIQLLQTVTIKEEPVDARR